MTHTLLAKKTESAEVAVRPRPTMKESPSDLRIGQIHDVFEQEAERVAARVMEGGIVSPELSFSGVGMGRPVQRECACGGSGECEECKKKTVQRMVANSTQHHIAPSSVHGALRSPGKPLDGETRALMEPRFGHDFSRVRIHAEASDAESAHAINATAYTVGHDIVFASGRYAPRTKAGNRLLAHELAHTIQQEGSDGVRTPRYVMRQPLHPDDPPRYESPIEFGPQFHKKLDAHAERENCEQFPGGTTDCEVTDETKGTLSGKVKTRVDETNPCNKPCVEKHEAVHVKQMKTFCPRLRDCYRDVELKKRSPLDCFKLANSEGPKDECAAYTVSVPCLAQRLAHAPECQSKENKAYATRVLKSENCFRDYYCSQTQKK